MASSLRTTQKAARAKRAVVHQRLRHERRAEDVDEAVAVAALRGRIERRHARFGVDSRVGARGTVPHSCMHVRPPDG